MASKRFEKTSEEWQMFNDYWKLCQKYWIVENNDEYWEEVIRGINSFIEKYKKVRLAREIGTAFINAKEYEFRKLNA